MSLALLSSATAGMASVAPWHDAAHVQRQRQDREAWATARKVECKDCDVSGLAFDGRCWNCGKTPKEKE